jgi:hypothetical protein
MKMILKFICIALISLFVTGCNSNAQKKSAKEMLNDPIQQKEIFNAISMDTVQMRQFMQYMMQAKSGMYMMGNQHMMMGNMLQMMENDSVYCNSLGRQMMNNTHMKGMMQNRCQYDEKVMGNYYCPYHKNK